MTSPDQSPSAKRSRGRPKGTAVYAERDLRALARYADVYIHTPHSPLAPFLRSVGYADDKDVRRARIRWGREKERLLKEARDRRDAKPAETILELIAYFAEAPSALKDAAAPGLEAVNRSLKRARARLRVMKEMGLDPDLPFDFKDEEQVAAAVRRYEERMFRPLSEKVAELPAVQQNELPMSLKLYSAAILLHELSLRMANGRSASDSPTHGSDSNRGEFA